MKNCEIVVARYKIYKDFRFEIFGQFICRRNVTDATKVIKGNFFFINFSFYMGKKLNSFSEGSIILLFCKTQLKTYKFNDILLDYF